jgi:hypothetical protein
MESPMHRLRSFASHTRLDDPHDPTTTGKSEAPMQSLNRNSGGPPQGKARSPQKTSLIGEGWLSLFKVASSSQAKQGGIMRLTRSPPDYNWATTHIASLPTGNSGGCPHHSPLLNKGPALIPNDESDLGKDWIMASPMH